ncbi:MAG TPA: hypothetical protein VN370_00490 [Desulfitobacteriaceae bacterium]|nr:hypothetical protein [Desulfitobacteriaceae bacterium]
MTEDVDWEKSCEVYGYCEKQGIDTGLQIPIVSNQNKNIILGDKIIGTYRERIEIFEKDLTEAVLAQVQS